MKKIVSLLFLGLLSICVLSPNYVNATDNQGVPESSSSLHSSGISPLSTPFITQVTLKNGESFEITQKYAYRGIEYGSPAAQIVVDTTEDEYYYMEMNVVGSNDPNLNIKRLEDYKHGFCTMYLPNTPDTLYFPEVKYKLTNYSSGEVTYNVEIWFGVIMPY